jgi:hypothetical protein
MSTAVLNHHVITGHHHTCHLTPPFSSHCLLSTKPRARPYREAKVIEWQSPGGTTHDALNETDEDGRSYVEYVSVDEDGKKSIEVRPSGTSNEKEKLARERSNARNRHPSPLQRRIAGTNNAQSHSKEGRNAQKRKERAKHAAKAEEKAEKRRLAEEEKKRAHDEKDRARHARLRHHRTELLDRMQNQAKNWLLRQRTPYLDDDATSLFNELPYDREIFFRQNAGDVLCPPEHAFTEALAKMADVCGCRSVQCKKMCVFAHVCSYCGREGHTRVDCSVPRWCDFNNIKSATSRKFPPRELL